MRYLLTILAAVALALSGCSKSPDDEQSVGPYDRQVGEWNPGMNEIRYVTKNGKDSRLGFETDAMITEKFFADGQWIVRFDKTVTSVRVDYDGVNDWITDFFLPDSLRGVSAWGTIMDLKEFYVPKCIEGMSVRLGDNLERFYGNNVSEDSRCVIVGGRLLAFASGGLEEYTLPDGIEIIGGDAFWHSGIRKVTVPEDVKTIQSSAFKQSRIEEVELPASLETIGSGAFHLCEKIKKFSGPCELVSDDGMYLTYKDSYSGILYMIHFAVGSGVTEYTVPEEVKGFDNYAFYGCRTLTELTFASELSSLPAGTYFLECDNLQAFHGPQVADDSRSIISKGNLYCAVCKGLTEYVVPEEVVSVNPQAFVNAEELESVRMSDNVLYLGGRPFYGCSNLKEITLSARMKRISSNMFENQNSIERIYCRAETPPDIYLYEMDKNRINFGKLKVYVPKGSLGAYMEHKSWEMLRPCLEEYEYTDLPRPEGTEPSEPAPEPEPEPETDPDGYVSKDYSRDGKVTVLQKAGKGSGADLVLIGDAYSDRLVSDGTYSDDMRRAYDAFFSEEPFKSCRDYFNVYQVTAVSRHEVYSTTSSTALETWFGDGTRVGGNDDTVFSYAEKAVPTDRMDDVLVIVVMNKGLYAGTTYLYPPKKGDYGNGRTIAYFGAVRDDATFASIVLHEAGGHGFAKLGDEYFDSGRIPQEEIDLVNARAEYGWYKNIDFTSDLSDIKWSSFIADERYASEGLGAFEGGLSYSTGLWHPTENSIMRNIRNGFNAPSREAVWYRIHKLAYGDEWEYDYEEFVKYDEINRKTATKAYGQDMRLAPLTPPVVR